MSGQRVSVVENDAASLTVSRMQGTENLSLVRNTIRASLRIDQAENLTFENRAFTRSVSIIESDGITFRNLTAGSVYVSSSNGSVISDITVDASSDYHRADTTVLETSSNNVVRNTTTETISLRSSPNNTIRNTSAEEVTLSSPTGNRLFSDNNTVAGNTADLIQVIDDSRNNTIRDNDAAVRIAGETSYDNVVVDNNASNHPVGIEIDGASRTIVENNTVAQVARGIVLESATGNPFVNNTVVDSGQWDYFATDGSTDNPITDLTVGPTVSFDSRDVAMKQATDPPQPPEGKAGIGAFIVVNDTEADAWVDLTVQYTDADAADVDEGSLRLWRYADGSWEPIGEDERLDTTDNQVSANVSGENFGIVAPLGDATDTQRPYGGIPATVPGEIDASHFDTGGEGVAYRDTTPERRDDSGFRPETSVDIESPSLGGTGDGSIGYVEEGEWLEYTIDAEPGTYRLSLAVASDRDSPGELTASVDGRKIGTIAQHTGGWYNFAETEAGEFTIDEGGEHTIRIESTGPSLNFDTLVVENASTPPAQQPYGGTPVVVPGEIDASHFDTGGEGVAYRDTTLERRDDSGFRPETSVDIESPSLGGTGDGSIGYVEEGEWLEYTIDAEPGTYRLSLAVASDQDGELVATVNGREIGTVERNTGGWYNFVETTAGEFTIDEGGEHTIRIEWTGPPLNVDRLIVEESGTTTEHTIEIVGSGEYTEYEFEVSGEVTGGSGLNPADSFSGSRASGTVVDGSDTYTFTGELTNLSVDGTATVRIREGE
ncbi:carbohydrate-binding protein [Salinigranum salinum]|uniref:carbohydrate-binding protein n=1 Tax=Salinigranum salinum TaxID=1364937 RepID=UPI0018652C81|nr:carbohydrate-binding protein [Salinigranum salinum]